MFDDHHGLEPGTLKNTEPLAKSKTHGRGKSPQKKTVYLDRVLASRPKLVMSATACWGSWRLTNDTTCCLSLVPTMQRFHRCLYPEGQEFLQPQLCSFCTPQSPRSHMSTCCAALGIKKSERDVLGPWSTSGSDRYVRLDKMLVQKLQFLLSSVLCTKVDPAGLLGEAETLSEIEEYLKQRRVETALISQELLRLDRSSIKSTGLPLR